MNALACVTIVGLLVVGCTPYRGCGWAGCKEDSYLLPEWCLNKYGWCENTITGERFTDCDGRRVSEKKFTDLRKKNPDYCKE
jgi:hypothetical protein